MRGKIQRGEMRRALLIEDQVAVDFIGNEHEVMRLAELRELHDLLRIEHATQRVLRIAQQENLRLFRNGLLHFCPIKLPAPSGENMIDGQQFRARVLVDTEERIIDRRAGHHLLARLAERPHRQRKRRHQPAEMDEVIRV